MPEVYFPHMACNGQRVHNRTALGTCEQFKGHHGTMPHVYILKCSDGSYYVGSTWDLERRVAQHNSSEGAAYTRRRRPVVLMWAQQHDRIDTAYAVKNQIQGWSRAKREALMERRFGDLPALSKSRATRTD